MKGKILLSEISTLLLFLLLCIFSKMVQPEILSGSVNGTHIDSDIPHFETLSKLFPYRLLGPDMDGSPTFLIEVGKWDVRTLVENGGPIVDAFPKYGEHMIQEFFNVSKAMGEDFVVLANTDGYTARQLTNKKCLDLCFSLVQKVSDMNRLGSAKLKHAYVVNANFVFFSFYNLLKPSLGELGNKIDMYGTQKDRYMPTLLKNIPKEYVQLV